MLPISTVPKFGTVQEKNHVEWCLKKAEKELKADGKHRGLVKVTSDKKKAKEHLAKAEHCQKNEVISVIQ